MRICVELEASPHWRDLLATLPADARDYFIELKAFTEANQLTVRWGNVAEVSLLRDLMGGILDARRSPFPNLKDERRLNLFRKMVALNNGSWVGALNLYLYNFPPYGEEFIGDFAEANRILARLHADAFRGPNKITNELVPDPAKMTTEMDRGVPAKFEHMAPTQPDLVRFQDANEDELRFFMQHGFQSRAPARGVTGIEQIEKDLANDREAFLRLQNLQKQGASHQYLNVPLVEATASNAWITEQLKNFGESGRVDLKYWKKGKIFAKVSSRLSVPYARDFRPPFGGEMGHFFIGSIPSSEVSEFLYIKPDAGRRLHFFYYTRDPQGAWMQTELLAHQILNFF